MNRVSVRNGSRLALGTFLLAFVLALLSSCSINKLAMNLVADALTGEGSNTVFTGDDDPALVGDALPFAIKLYESLLAQSPDHRGLIQTTGSLYVMYANAFIAGPAEFYTVDRFEDQIAAKQRAHKLYLRGWSMLVDGMDKLHPGFKTSVNGNSVPEALKLATKDDVGILYWAAAAWLSAFSLNPMDPEVSFGVQRAISFALRAHDLDPAYQQGTIDELLMQIYASLPPELGGDMAKAEDYYQQALVKNGGKNPSTYVGYAFSVLLAKKDKAGFVAALKKALSFNPDSDPNSRLQTILSQAKATWYLNHLDTVFYEDDFQTSGN